MKSTTETFKYFTEARKAHTKIEAVALLRRRARSRRLFGLKNRNHKLATFAANDSPALPRLRFVLCHKCTYNVQPQSAKANRGGNRTRKEANKKQHHCSPGKKTSTPAQTHNTPRTTHVTSMYMPYFLFLQTTYIPETRCPQTPPPIPLPMDRLREESLSSYGNNRQVP